MAQTDMSNDPFVQSGLRQLGNEAFGPNGFATGMEEVVHILIHRGSNTLGYGHMIFGNKVIFTGRTDSDGFSDAALNVWLDECRIRAYSIGAGTWTTAEVHVYPDRPGILDLYDEERVERDAQGHWPPGGEPAGAQAWAQQLLAYPRTVDNIPSWMWDIFRAEGVTPPIYNPEFKSVDWKNRRRPVTDRGTDFSVEPTIIDPSLESGVLSRIGKKLFGSRS
ncbi:hypothetical protein ACIPWF_19030 [Paenarthrobacter sp. NPDC089989]|uniref:hypothetical protein n=1 Tax=unclassified Paenarthrobacter TaxID=2634190 RepID=UPI00381E626A